MHFAIFDSSNATPSPCFGDRAVTDAGHVTYIIRYSLSKNLLNFYLKPLHLVLVL